MKKNEKTDLKMIRIKNSIKFPFSSATRRYRPLDLDDDAISSPGDSAKTERSMSDAFERVEVDLVSDMSVAMDRITNNVS